MKKLLLAFLPLLIVGYSHAQTQIITPGNNLVDPNGPLAADIVIGSSSNNSTRHDASIMWSTQEVLVQDTPT